MTGQPIWIKNKREVRNLQVGFRCDFDAKEDSCYRLRVTGATYYRIFLNGEFIGYGPARAGHGYVKCDEIVLLVENGINKLAIEVAGYYCSSFYTRCDKSFLCAEILEDDKVVKYTGRDFNALSLEKLRNVNSHRYSFQRAYGEVWNFDQEDKLTHWTTEEELSYEKYDSFTIEEEYLDRNLPMPNYRVVKAQCLTESGKRIAKDWKNLRLPRYFTDVSNRVDGYLTAEWKENPLEELYGDFLPDQEIFEQETYIVEKNRYLIFKLQTNDTGFLMNKICALEDSKVCVFFSEYNYGNGMIFDSLEGQCNIVTYNLKKNEQPYELESFEPYVCQYIGVTVLEGRILLNPPKLREYSYPEYENLKFWVEDPAFVKIMEAAKNSFRQNTLDVFMDCPGRERAGWLCDSYFTSQSEKIFTGKSRVEKAFLENYVMAKEFPNLPIGMMPHNYPCSIKKYNDGYIPQWAMWYIVELGEYCEKRSGESPEKYKTLCYDLLEWLHVYENRDGLLESMPGWNFVEWSEANNWTKDVNYPTNMLYSKMLAVMGRMFLDEELIKKSEQLKEKILEQSFDGTFFVDNAVRDKEGNLCITTNYSETCQYYAIFFEVLPKDKECSEKFKHRMISQFGSKRKLNNPFPQIVHSNAFVGNYLRIIILLRMQCFDKVLEDIKGYFTKMAEMTGTLWEHDDLEKGGSLNHGFASFAGVALAFALGGISDIDFCKGEVLAKEEYRSGIDFEFQLSTDKGVLSVSEQDGKKTIKLPEEWVMIRRREFQ